MNWTGVNLRNKIDDILRRTDDPETARRLKALRELAEGITFDTLTASKISDIVEEIAN